MSAAGAAGMGEDPAMIFGARVPMAATLGLIGEEIREDFARIRMPYRPDLTNSGATFHGGALMSLLDVVLCCAARSIDSSGLMVITIDLSAHFISSSRHDVIGEARCLKRGKSFAFSQGEVRSLDGELLATATGTLKLVPRR